MWVTVEPKWFYPVGGIRDNQGSCKWKVDYFEKRPDSTAVLRDLIGPKEQEIEDHPRNLPYEIVI